MKLAQRMVGIGTETAFEAAARARALEAQGRHIVHLEIGEPDFDTPENIREAAKRALDEGWTHYGPPLGQPKLREAIAAGVEALPRHRRRPGQRRRHARRQADHVLRDPRADRGGRRGHLPRPGLPDLRVDDALHGRHAGPVRAAGGERLPLRRRRAARACHAQNQADHLQLAPQPHWRRADSRGHHGDRGHRPRKRHPVMADEIYGRGIFEGEHVSIASLPGMLERTIILDGFSKAWAMTGWRLGFAVLPPALVDPFSKLIINSVSCTSSFEQMAAVEALNGPQDAVRAMVEEFRARRQLIVDGLNAIPGFRCRMPHGAFYVFPNVAGTGMNGSEMADKLLHDGGVCTLSGTAFGKVGKDHIRISYANSQENLKLALQRIEEVVSKTPAGATA